MYKSFEVKISQALYLWIILFYSNKNILLYEVLTSMFIYNNQIIPTTITFTVNCKYKIMAIK